MRRLAPTALASLATVTVLTGCVSGNDDSEPPVSLHGATTAEQFPEVLAVAASYDDVTATWTFAVTISSSYDTPERYADGWRVIGADGTVYGTHTLTHDHAAEQPFTRTQAGVEISADVEEVTIEGRDLVNGFGGATVTISLQTDGS